MPKKKKITLKTMVVGYHGAGKTSLIITLLKGQFPEEDVPSVAETYSYEPTDKDSLAMSLWDTGGGEDYPRLRPLTYPQTDVFLLLFDIAGSRSEFDAIDTYWSTELKEFCPDVPCILLGTKIDQREADGIKTTGYKEGVSMADRIGASCYMEISAMKNRGVSDLINEAFRIGYDHYLTNKSKRRRCTIL